MYSRSKIVSTLQGWIGYNESDGTHKQIIDIYNSQSTLPRGYKAVYTDPWCAITVSAASVQCGYEAIIPTECSCSKMIELLKEIDEWEENDAYVPASGDIIFYDWDDSGSGDDTGNPEHVGVVETVNGNSITVIEGNYNDAVGRRTISVNGQYIRGYGVPKYDEASSDTSGSTVAAGTQVKLTKTKLYSSSTATSSSTIITGTYYIWSSDISNKRIRITNKASNVGVTGQVTGWVNISDTGLELTETEEVIYEEDDVIFAEPKTYKNGSTSEPVYADTQLSNKIGSLDPYETCYCLGIYDGKYIVCYTVNGTSTYKVGFVSYSGGVK